MSRRAAPEQPTVRSCLRRQPTTAHLCGPDTFTYAQSVANATTTGPVPNGFQSSQQNPTIPNAQPVNAGTYYLTITVNGQTSSDSSNTVAYIYQPAANAGNDTSIANGVYRQPARKLHRGKRFLHLPLGACGQTGGSGCEESANGQPVRHNDIYRDGHGRFGQLRGNGSGHRQCHRRSPGRERTANPSSICAGDVRSSQAIGSGGAGNYTYEWSGPGGFNSTLPNPTVQPAVTTTYSVTVNDGYNSASNTVTVTVNQLPVANAGINDTIPHGTYTYLNGQ